MDCTSITNSQLSGHNDPSNPQVGVSGGGSKRPPAQ